MLHSSLCLFPPLKNSFSSSLTTFRQILNKFSFYRAFFPFFSIDHRQILDPLRNFLVLSTFLIASLQILSIDISGFLLDRISTASRSIKISGILLDNFFDPLSKILVLFVCSIDSRQILDPSRPSFSRRQILDRFSSIEI